MRGLARVGDCSWPSLGGFVRVLDLVPAKSQKVLYWIARVIATPNHRWVLVAPSERPGV